MIEPHSQSFNLADNLEKQIEGRKSSTVAAISAVLAAHRVPVLPDAFAPR
jgi:hypothetical protein